MQITSAKVFAFDFIEKSEYESYIESIETEFSPPDTEAGIGNKIGAGNSYTVHSLGVFSTEESPFSEIFIGVIGFNAIPDIRCPILRATITETDLDDLNLDQDLHHELSDIWGEIFPDLKSVTLTDSPLTIFSGKFILENLDDQFPISDDIQSKEDLRDNQPLVQYLRSKEFSNKFGIQQNGLVSVESDYDEYLILTGQSWWTSSGDQIKHNGYSILEFVSEDHPFASTPEMDMVGPFSFGTRSDDRVRRLIPLLFYFYWFRKQIYREKPKFRDALREIPVGVRENEDIDDLIDTLQDREYEFYDQYVSFLEKIDAAESYLDNLSDTITANIETGVPLTSEQRPPARTSVEDMEYEFDFQSGTLSIIISDVREVMAEAEQEYDRLLNRYDIVLEELNQQIDLTLAKQNQEMNESSVELQRDVQQLTKFVALLTIVLVYFGFIDLILRTSIIAQPLQLPVILTLTAGVIFGWLRVSENLSHDGTS